MAGDGPTCGARLKGEKGAAGETCKRPAGWGTDHPGAGQCSMHGGKTPIGNRNAARPMLALLVGHKIDVSPMEALLMCVRITAAEATFFSAKIAAMEEKEVITRPRAEQLDRDGMVHDLRAQRQLNIWIRERRRALLDLARFSKMALDAGVEERMVRVAENIGEQLATFVKGLLTDLHLSEEQEERAPEIVRRHLRVLQGGNAA